MRDINYIVIHCSATESDVFVNAAYIRGWHKQKGWSDIGYHYVILRDGSIEKGRPDDIPGAHVKGHNHDSLGICLVGGLDKEGNAECNFTFAQWYALDRLISGLRSAHPDAQCVGHRDLSPDLDDDGEIEKHEWLKECPTFDVASLWKE